MTEAYHTYKQLVARVEAFAQTIQQRYPGRITCHVGCDGCCYQQFTIFPIEAHHLAQTIAQLTPEARQQVRQRVEAGREVWYLADQPQPCVLLEHGRCCLYEGRPLICRIHGYPLSSAMIDRPDGRQRDCCPLNFADMALDDIDAQAVYNLDLVNQALAAINHLFVQEHGIAAPRVTIRQAVVQALEALLCKEQGEGEPDGDI